MNKRNLLVTLSAIGLAICIVFWIGSRSFNAPKVQVWSWGIGAILCGVFCAWAWMLQDSVPDVLGEAGFSYFERDGFCFALIPGVVGGRLVLNLFYQSRYSEPSSATILVHPTSSGDGRQVSELKLRVNCEGGGVGQVTFPWQVVHARPGGKVECCIGAGVHHPNGHGVTLRSRTGSPVSSIEEASVPELFHLLATPARITFPFPEGVRASEIAASPVSSPEAPESATPRNPAPKPASISSATVEAKRTGMRAMSVICERCSHSYEYTLRREVTATGEDPDQSVALKKAEEAAQRKLDQLLAEGTDVVPCPKCGVLTARMRKEKQQHRKEGAAAMGAGAVVIVVGLGICGIVYLIEQATHRLFYVIGIFGLAVAGIGVVMILKGLSSAVTGSPLEDTSGQKD